MAWDSVTGWAGLETVRCKRLLLSFPGSCLWIPYGTDYPISRRHTESSRWKDLHERDSASSRNMRSQAIQD